MKYEQGESLLLRAPQSQVVGFCVQTFGLSWSLTTWLLQTSWLFQLRVVSIKQETFVRKTYNHGNVTLLAQSSSNEIIGIYYGAFTLDVKSMLYENLGGILGGTQC